MQRRVRLAIALALFCGCSQPPAEPPPRHLVLVTIDTLRADRLGVYGYPRPTSPQLDALAARGIRFDDALSQAISTPPSHASILTGLNPPQHGLRSLSGQRLDPGNLTLAEVLRDAGFDTAAFVSGVPLRRELGLDQGFAVYDDAVGETGERIAGDTNAAVAAWLSSLPESGPAGASDRLFLWVHYFDPHMPYFAPPAQRAAFDAGKVRLRDLASPVATNRRGRPREHVPAKVARRMSNLYDAEVAYTDEQVGQLFAMLEAHGLLADAIVAVVADHGECLGERGYYYGHWDVFRETARIPMILARPDARWAGSSVDATVRSIDLMPTLLGWLGLTVPAGLEGRDLTPLLEGRETTPRSAYTEQLEYFPARALREGPWMLMEHDFGPSGRRPGMRHVYGLSAGGGEDRVLAPPEAAKERLAMALRAAAEPTDARPAVEIEMSDETTERLRALGYVVAPD